MLFWMLLPHISAFSAGHLPAYEHVVTVQARADDGGSPRVLDDGTYLLASKGTDDRRDEALADAAQHAAKKLAERQQAPGYWLTMVTDNTRFEQPHQEINTYTSAVMIDVAGPVSVAAGITSLLDRARHFLSDQIEESGLVRYQGRPDAKLGCAFTPDADDTALVWRIAPGAHRDLLPKALATLKQYRTREGLYRTWLAPEGSYKCVAPDDQSRPDIGVQMHMFMLLVKADPQAARALCGALSHAATDESIWVYYQMTPLIPLLHLADLDQAGCPLHLPQSKLQAAIAGQEIWVEAVELLRHFQTAQITPAEVSRISDLLTKLAADDFSLLARTPVLLYHSDFALRGQRFYWWSEDVGYALWLRLYYENERARLKSPCRANEANAGCGKQ